MQTTTLSVREILTVARDLVAREGGWCQGENESSYRRNLTAFCAVGAIAQSCRLGLDDEDDWIYTTPRFLEAESCLESAADFISPMGRWLRVSDWNDEDGRTQAEVVALFDAAIAKAT